MTWEIESLKHVVQQAKAVYLVLGAPLDEARFRAVLHCLSCQAGTDTQVTPDEHWLEVSRRARGEARWDSIVPKFVGPLEGADGATRFKAAEHSVRNILNRRRYTAYTIKGIQYVIDLFNPANELEMSYAGAGETVVALLLREVEFGNVQSRLVENAVFYSILRDITRILEPEYVRGTYSMFPVLRAYEQGRLEPRQRPWDLLFPLSVLAKPTERADGTSNSKSRTTNDSLALLWPILTSPKVREVPLGRLFKKIDVWDENHVLVQVWNGLEALLRDEYAQAARTLGMTAVQELVVT